MTILCYSVLTSDMMIVCISSHGNTHGRIISSDCRELDLEYDILRSHHRAAPGHHNVFFCRRFNNMFCPKLKGKPKFFLIQACRGDDVDFGLSPDISTVLKLEDTDSRKVKSPTLLASRPRSLTFPEMLTRANKVTTVYKQ